MTFFVDTAAFYALLDRDDANHHRAAEAWPAVLDQDPVATNYVVLETSALLQARLGLIAVRAFWEDIVPVVHLHWVDEAVHRVAMAALLAAGRRGLSLVDTTSFEVMRLLGSRQVFTFDEDFEREGFECLP